MAPAKSFAELEAKWASGATPAAVRSAPPQSFAELENRWAKAPPAVTQPVDTYEDRSTFERQVADPVERGGRRFAADFTLRSAADTADMVGAMDAIDRGEEVEADLPSVQAAGLEEYRTASPERRQEIRARAVDLMNRTLATSVGQYGEAARIPQNPAMGEFAAAGGRAVESALSGELPEAADLGEAAGAVASSPGLLSQAFLESLSNQAVPIAALLATRSAGATMAGAGLGAAGADYLNQFGEALSRQGVDLTDQAAVEKAIRDPAVMAEVSRQAKAHAAMVGLAGALSAGLAKVPIAAGPVKDTVVKAPAQAVIEGAGEAAGQQVATGEISGADVAMEAAVGLAGAPVEVAAARLGRPVGAEPSTTPVRPQTEDQEPAQPEGAPPAREPAGTTPDEDLAALREQLPPDEEPPVAEPVEPAAAQGAAGVAVDPAPGAGVPAVAPEAVPEQPAVPERAAGGQPAAGEAPATPEDVGRAVAEELRRTEGTERVLATPRGNMRVGVSYEVVDASTLTPAAGAVQPRDRSRIGSDKQVQRIANELDPARLMTSDATDRGAPIVGEDNVVESGNGRLAAIKLARETNPDGYAAYRRAIEAAGFNTAGMEAPVLIARRQTPLSPDERQRFTRLSNEDDKLKLSAPERARIDAEQIDDELLDAWAPGTVDIMAGANRRFRDEFLRRVTEGAAEGDMVTASGDLSADGEARLRRALEARAYGEARAIDRLHEDGDDNAKAVSGALRDAAGDWARLRAGVRRGRIDPRYDITDRLLQSVETLRTARIQGQKPADVLAQTDAFQQVDPVVAEMFRAFHDPQMGRAAGRQRVRAILSDYADKAARAGEPGLLGAEGMPSPESVLADARRAAWGERVDAARYRVTPEERAAAEATVAEASRIISDLTGGRVTLQAAPRLRARIDGELRDIDGAYMDRVVKASLSRGNLRETVRHEVLHALRQMGLIRPDEWAVLSRRAKQWRRIYKTDQQYAPLRLSEEALNEEAVAEALARHRSSGQPKSLQDVVFRRIKQFLRRLGSWLRRQGFQDWQDVFSRIERGEVGRRPDAAPTGAQEPAYRLGGSSNTPPDKLARLDRVMGTTDRPLGQRLREGIDQIHQGFIQGVFDSFRAIGNLEKSVHGRLMEGAKSAYKTTRLVNDMRGVLAHVLRHGPVEIVDGWPRPVKALAGGKPYGFEAIFRDVTKAGKLDEWMGWMIATRADRLKGEDREKLLTDDDIKAFLDIRAEDRPMFEKAAEMWRDFNKANLDLAEAAGTINAEQRALWERDDYVPFYRLLEATDGVAGPRSKKGIAGQSAGIRKLTGGEAKINHLVENMWMNTAKLVESSYRNLAMAKVARLGLNTGAMKPEPMAFRPTQVNAKDLADKLEEVGVDIANVPKDVRDQMVKLWTMQAPKDPEVVSVMIDGKRKYLRVEDPLLLRALTSLTPSQSHMLIELMSGAKSALTTGVTSTPDFFIRSFLRESLGAWVVGGAPGFVPFVDSVRGIAKSLAGSASRQAISAAGGGVIEYYHPRPTDVRKQVAELERRGVNVLNTPRKAWRGWQRIGEAIDESNRIAVYERLRKAGASEAEAAYQARDLMDFSLRGDHQAIRSLVEVVPFLNARLQGLYRLGRGFMNNPLRFMLTGSIITAATWALMAAQWDDERYQDLPDWQKDLYWTFWIGDQEFVIPRPFEVGLMFATIPERAMRAMLGADTTQQTAASAMRAVEDTLAFDPFGNPLTRTAIDLYANRDNFTGMPIVPMGLERRLPEEQYTPDTSETARAVGGALGVSPLQLEHTVRGLFGTLGLYVMAAADNAIVEPLTDDAPEPDLRLEDIPVVRAFMRDEPAKTNVYVGQFYELREEMRKIHTSYTAAIKEGRTPEAIEYRQRLNEMGGEGLRRMVEAAGDRMSDIRKQQQAIMRARGMTGAEKRRHLDALTAERNALAKRVEQARRRLNP